MSGAQTNRTCALIIDALRGIGLALDRHTEGDTMKQSISQTVLIITYTLLTATLAWAESPGPMVRPFAGVGYSNSSGARGDGVGTHVGARIMLSSNEYQRFGVEITYLDLYALDDGGPDIRYAAVGIVVEQTLWNWFLLSIGTLGYIGIGDNKDKPFGIRTNLGWESNDNSGFQPFIVYRGDFIFDDPSTSVTSFSAGIRIRF